jgi:hypothetical protein
MCDWQGQQQSCPAAAAAIDRCCICTQAWVIRLLLLLLISECLCTGSSIASVQVDACMPLYIHIHAVISSISIH